MRALLRALALPVVPVAILAAGFALVIYAAALPRAFAGFIIYSPHIMFALGIALAVWYGRGRAVFALLVLATAYAARQWWLQEGVDGFHARAVYAALTVFVPLDLALLALLPERGVLNRHGALRFGVLLAQIAITAWVFVAGRADFVDLAYQKFLDPIPLSAGRLPQFAILAIALGFAVAAIAAFVRRSHLNASFAGAIAAFAIAAHVPNAYVTFASFIAAAELMVAIAVLQDAHRMAFRDELTGIPSRRALNEQLAALGSRYTVAMLDVDHFKKFNDTYGHDLGDQVLKMVAAHIARVGGGGKAFRYGGEEFTVLFPGKDAEDAIPHLEAVREDIESYRMALRASDRPAQTRQPKRQKGGWRDKRGVSVTVSIGIAERNGRSVTPQAVIEAADRALYRAKEKGRNRLSR
ncbi:MAG TPA: GGDEF domain-containing protein [Burkholderiales bacterium]|nr:GGDEF domain-containing protein [Burkholderiales bacterium]